VLGPRFILSGGSIFYIVGEPGERWHAVTDCAHEAGTSGADLIEREPSGALPGSRPPACE
jgi:hypothetical protein